MPALTDRPLPTLDELESRRDPAGYARRKVELWERRLASAVERGDRFNVRLARQCLATWTATLAAMQG